jgi:hypothetical protein
VKAIEIILAYLLSVSAPTCEFEAIELKTPPIADKHEGLRPND